MSRESILKEIEEKKRELLELEKKEKLVARGYAIKDLSEFSDDEKIKMFDKMYKSAESSLEQSIKDGYHDEDNMHYGGEEYFEILARNKKDFWDFYNSIEK